MVRFSNRRPESSAGAARVRRRADERRVAILRAAGRVFRERGFAAAGMREIAVAADLSAANLYHYFRGKDELLFFCQNRTLDRLLDALDRARAAGAPIAARLHELAAAHVRCLVDEVDGSAAHLEVDALPPKRRAAIVAKRDRYERGVRALVADGIRRGALRAADATIATRAFLGALNWTASWYRPDGQQAPNVVAEHVSAYAVAGLVGAPAARRSAARTKRIADEKQRRAGARSRARVRHAD